MSAERIARISTMVRKVFDSPSEAGSIVDPSIDGRLEEL